VTKYTGFRYQVTVTVIVVVVTVQITCPTPTTSAGDQSSTGGDPRAEQSSGGESSRIHPPGNQKSPIEGLFDYDLYAYAF